MGHIPYFPIGQKFYNFLTTLMLSVNAILLKLHSPGLQLHFFLLDSFITMAIEALIEGSWLDSTIYLAGLIPLTDFRIVSIHVGCHG